jgi:hypothetical protein
MADEAVNAYNINHPALQPMSFTHKVLRDVSSKFWKHVNLKFTSVFRSFVYDI